MRVVVTDTPGTGKTTATERVATDLGLDVVHLNRLMRDEGFWTKRDDEHDMLVVDLDAARDELGGWDDIIESHLIHRFEADRVVVLRCRPDVLEQHLLDHGETEVKAYENHESETLDVILGEAIEFYGEKSVYEIDTTDRDPDTVTDDVAAVVADEREPSAGAVDFIDYL